ncbi:hypothetical protein NHX12_027907 [Muraenolepis orangiensis]|uniref:Uncharacterized protein n=1 Tax=Muraenolepis orangiensis TaxID=630683 RepID=A0A9Q0EFK7_9TELE|nr:hypothetical protein NHX12_027907 [Muraenolepis orangiensis]
MRGPGVAETGSDLRSMGIVFTAVGPNSGRTEPVDPDVHGPAADLLSAIDLTPPSPHTPCPLFNNGPMARLPSPPSERLQTPPTRRPHDEDVCPD